MKGLLIEGVAPGSIAEEFELEPGDRLLAINGHPLRDLIDYSYYSSSEEELLLEIARTDGEIWELEVEREAGEPLGLTFAPPAPARCRNNCVFCFVHQLPKGLRKPLYVKDEDYRLSFLNGNYVTLANISSTELNRIIQQRLSPLYISVHTTNPDLRRQMLGTAGIPPILAQLQALASARISLHTQIVLCPGINDGPELERTVTDLAALHPAVQSLAIVPLGLPVIARTCRDSNRLTKSMPPPSLPIGGRAPKRSTSVSENRSFSWRTNSISRPDSPSRPCGNTATCPRSRTASAWCRSSCAMPGGQ